jgi:hypothetical protein
MDVVCLECGKRFTGKPGRSFLGFLKFDCPHCRKVFQYPLTGGYRWIYRLAIGLVAVIEVVAIARGTFAIPGGLAIGGAWALYADSKLRKRVAGAEDAARLPA